MSETDNSVYDTEGSSAAVTSRPGAADGAGVSDPQGADVTRAS